MPNSTAHHAPTFKVNIVTGKGGGGHYATYHALKDLAQERSLPWQFQVTDMDDIMADMTQTKGSVNAYKWLGSSVSDLYNSMLKRGWTWLWPLQMRLNKLLVKLNFSFALSYFRHYWQQQQPDIVISVVTMCNKVLWQALHETFPGTPYVTVMIDFADVPPGFWIEPDTDSYLICGKQRAVEQAQALGVPSKRIISTSGMVIHSKFQPPTPEDRPKIIQGRIDQGLSPDRLTGLVMFGGNGNEVMVKIAQALSGLGDRTQLIFLCGHNETLFHQLNDLPNSQNRLIVGFTPNVAKYMALSDFFIGKPGPGSLSEALAMNLPVITERNFSTLVHERYNADWIEQAGMGIVLPSFSKVASAVEQFLHPPTFERYQKTVRAYDNHAVSEVCDLVTTLLKKSLLEKSAKNSGSQTDADVITVGSQAGISA
ncbi:MAG: glycosyltransferase [Cyanobacteria bacterium J06607_13]